MWLMTRLRQAGGPVAGLTPMTPPDYWTIPPDRLARLCAGKLSQLSLPSSVFAKPSRYAPLLSLGSLDRLTVLRMQTAHVGGLLAVLQAVAVRELHFDGQHGPDAMDQVLQVLLTAATSAPSALSVAVLSFVGCTMTVATAHALASVLEAFFWLEGLHLNLENLFSPQQTGFAWDAVAQALGRCRRLRALSLAGLPVHATKKMTAAIARCASQTVDTLALSELSDGRELQWHCNQAAAGCSRRLRRLSLEDCEERVTPDHASALCTLIGACQHLADLRLASLRLTSESTAAVLAAVAASPALHHSLQELCLDDNAASVSASEGQPHLAAVVQQCARLDVLRLRRCLATPGGSTHTPLLDALTTALQGATQLRVLELGGCRLGDRSCTSLAGALAVGAPSLKVLSLSSNRIALGGMEALCDSLETRDTAWRLAEIDLRGNPFGSAVTQVRGSTPPGPVLRFSPAAGVCRSGVPR